MKSEYMKYAAAMCAAALALTAGTANAGGVLFADDFDAYTDGNLVPQGGWANHSGTGNLIQVNSGQIMLEHGSGSREDVNHSLGATMGAGSIWTASFDVIVGGSSGVVAETSYFAHFRDAGFGFNSRIFVTAANASGDFTFGIGETSSSTPADTYGTDFSYGTSYRVTASYNFDTGISELTIGGFGSILSTSQADPGEDISTFAFRQAGGNTTQTIDNLVIVPAPTTLAMLGLGMLSGVSRRRRTN